MRGDTKVGYIMYFTDGPRANDMRLTGLPADLFVHHGADEITLYKRQTDWEYMHHGLHPKYLKVYAADYAVVPSEVRNNRDIMSGSGAIVAEVT